MDNTDIIRKIRALLSKASGTENEHEAAAFAGKAHAMLSQYNISTEELLRSTATDAGESVGKSIHPNKYVGGWRNDLMNATAKYYFCKLLITREGDRKAFLLIGKPHNVAVATSMFDYLEKTTIRLGRDWLKASHGTRSEQLAFEKGCGWRIAARLDEMRIAAANQPATGGGGLPALFNNEMQLVQDFLAGMGLRPRAAKARGAGKINAGFFAGRAAAEGVGLGGQVAQAPRAKAIA